MFKEFISLFNPKNLPTINKTFWRGVIYTLFATVLVAIGWFTVMYLSLSSLTGSLSPTTSLQSVAQSFLKEYPSDLQLSMSPDGLLTKNIPGPIGLLRNPDITEEDSYKYVVVIDDKPATIENYKDSESVIYIGSDGLVGEDNESLRVLTFKQMLDKSTKQDSAAEDFKGFVVGKTDIENFINMSIPVVVKVLALVILLSFVLLPFIFTIVHVVWTVIVALLAYMLMLLLKKGLDFNESYMIALYAGVPAILLGSILGFWLDITLIQTIFTIIWIILGYFVFNKNEIGV